jgi:NADH-quinone oxidoreductase subunit K
VSGCRANAPSAAKRARNSVERELPAKPINDSGERNMTLPGQFLEHYVLLSTLIFTIGAVGFVVRRNVLVQLMCIELMLNAVNLAFVAFNHVHPGNMNGHVFAFFIIAIAAAEAAVGLAITLAFYRLKGSVYTDEADALRY